MIKIDLKRYRREVVGGVIVLLLLIGGISVFKYTSFNSGFEIVDDLGGNIFPSAILSVATTDAQVITPSDSTCLGNPKSCIAVRVKSRTAYSRVRIEVAETPFFSRSVSEFVLNKPRTEYTIYPDIIWNYEALKNNAQAEPVSVRFRCVASMNACWVMWRTGRSFTIPVSFLPHTSTKRIR